MPAPTGSAPAATGPALDAVALGGLGEFGMNMMALTVGGATILVDAGVQFPGPHLPGVDLVIPDLTHLQESGTRVAALFLTHGHEDHIGAVPYVWPLLDGPVYGTPLTLALVAPKLEEHGIDPQQRLVEVSPPDMVAVGDSFHVELLRVTHSIPDAVALAIRTPAGLIVHTGDFKFDQTPPDGRHFDLHRLATLGSEGVLALFSDSTNVDRPGFTGSEIDVIDGLDEIFTTATGKIVVAAFSSSLFRLQILVDLAGRHERKVAFVGRGMVENSQIAQRLGHLHLPAQAQIRDSEIGALSPERVLCITTGSQGEPASALSRIAVGAHRHVTIGAGDTVVFSARVIPGNERAIGRVSNHLARRGAHLIFDGHRHVHVSGHGSEEELKLMLSLLRPRYVVPIHGEYRQLARHAQIVERVTAGVERPSSALLAENGDIVRFDGDGARVIGKAPAGRVLIDGTRTGEVGDEVLRDRRHLSEDGVVVPVVAISRQTGVVEEPPEIISRGVVMTPDAQQLIQEAVDLLTRVVNEARFEERTDHDVMQEKVRVELRRFFRKRAGRRPLVLPVIMEI